MSGNNYSEIIAKEAHSVFGFFVDKFRLVYLLLIAITALGLYSVFTLPRESDPEVKIPFATVTTVYPGATPSDVEELITAKLEEKIENLEHVKLYTSSSGTGISSIFVEYEAEADLGESIRKLNDAIDGVAPSLPSDAEDPVVAEIRANDFPIVTYSLVGNYSEIELEEFAETLQDAFTGIPGVSKAPIAGGTDREFQIIVDPTRLSNFGVSLSQIMAAVSRANINAPAGHIEIDGFKYNVRVQGKFQDATNLSDVVIATRESTPIYLSDVAQVIDAIKERETKSRIGFPGQEATNTISLQIFKKTGANILNIVDEAHGMVATLAEDGTFPEDLKIEKTNDNAVWIRKDLATLGGNGIQTMILIFVLLALVIGFKEALITSLSVPIAFLMAFIALSVQGMTLNGIVLFALVLSLGLMVDNSIVIIEGINEFMEKHGMNSRDAALMSIWTYRWPITSGTLTTVAAFLPMLLVSGILGEYLSFMPKTITWTLLASLAVALVILPTLISRALKNGTASRNVGHHAKIKHGIFHTFLERQKVYYAKALANILPSKKKRRIALASAWILFAAAVAMPMAGAMKIEMFPKVDLDYFVINIELSQGSVLEATDKTTAEVERLVAGIPELTNYVTNLGTSASVGLTDAFASGGGASSNRATITVNLAEERERPSFAIAESMRGGLARVQGAEVRVQELSAGPPTGAPIEMRITGPDTGDLERAAKSIVAILQEIPGVINVTDSTTKANAEFTYTIDKQKANFYGLDAASVAQTLRTALFGTTAGTATVEGDDIDIVVKYDKAIFNGSQSLDRITLPSARGESIPLSLVSSLSLEPTTASIGRRNGEKVITVRAEVSEGFSAAYALEAFEEARAGLALPENVDISIGGEVEDIEQSFKETFYSMILAVLLILIILVLQFNSFKQPLIILFTLPLAMIGVILGLMATRQPFSFPVFIGLVALSGIAVNDAIVLIDKINKNLAKGMEYVDAIIDSGTSRIQPILLTSLTTIAGIFPLIFTSELWRGLSITIIFGLSASTILTLVMVPILYMGFARKEAEARRLGER